jgi:hypothetical protein
MPVGSDSASLEITRITKLYLRVTLDDVRTSDSSGTRYGIGIQREAAPNPLQRRKRPSIYASLPGDAIKKDAFTLLEASGPPDNPQLKLKLSDSDDPVSIETNKPYTSVDGYAADLYFPSEKRSFPNKRSVGTGTAAETTVFFGGESYKIVAINTNEVVLLSARTEKKTTIKYNAVPEPR